MRYARFWMSQKIVLFGLWLMPAGAAKEDLTEILRAWTHGVWMAVWTHRLRTEGKTAARVLAMELAKHDND